MALSLSDIDEALLHASLVPEDQRGLVWQRWVDSLLEQRTRLAAPPAARRTTRVMASAETR